MNHLLAQFAKFLGTGVVHDHVVQWLRTVPGLPPIVQTIHILSIACVMGSIAMIDLRVLNLAVCGQNIAEMTKRLSPWLWASLVLLLLSGAMFVVTRPRRYFANPIFGIKMALLLVALAFTLALRRTLSKKNETDASLSAKLFAGASLIAWLGVVLAGRWIAYVDYIFPQE